MVSKIRICTDKSVRLATLGRMQHNVALPHGNSSSAYATKLITSTLKMIFFFANYTSVYKNCEMRNTYASSWVRTSAHSSNTAKTLQRQMWSPQMYVCFDHPKNPSNGMRQLRGCRTMNHFWRITKGFAICIWTINWSIWWYFSHNDVYRVYSLRLHEHHGSLYVFAAFAAICDNKFGAFDIRHCRAAVHVCLDLALYATPKITST